MTGAKHRQKGNRQERAIVDLLRSHGLNAYRVPLSGSCVGFKDDIEVRLPNKTMRIESKARGNGFTSLYRWLEGTDVLIIKADRERALAVLDFEEFARLLAAQCREVEQ
jgi:Holliday junction resolvase